MIANPIPAPPPPIDFFQPDSTVTNNQRMFRTSSAYKDEGLGAKVWRALATGQYAVNSGGNTEISQWGGSVGGEVGANDVIRLGAAINYTNAEISNKEFGSSKVDGLGFSVYALIDAPVLKARIAYARMGYDEYPLYASSLGSKVLARSDSAVNHMEFDGAMDFALGKFTTGPIFGARYNFGKVEEMRWTDTNGTSLIFSETEYKSLITHLGWKVGMDVPTGFGRVTPQIRLAWEHEFIGDERRGLPDFSPAGTARILAGQQTATLDQDWITIGAGIEVATRSNFSLSAGYDTYLGLDTATEHFWNVNGSLSF